MDANNIYEYWSLNYHIYKFIYNGGTICKAIQRYNNINAILYFHSFIKNNI